MENNITIEVVLGIQIPSLIIRTTSHKLQYLIQNCEGWAKEAIKDMVVLEPSKGYNEAMITFKDLFGPPHIIARTFVEEIVNGEPLKNNDTCVLSELANKMKHCNYPLQSLGYEAATYYDVYQ